MCSSSTQHSRRGGENTYEYLLSSLSSVSLYVQNIFSGSQMSSSPGHLNKEKKPTRPLGQEPLQPPSHHLLLPCAWNTDVSSSRLLGMNGGCSNELICLQDMLICQADCNHACNLTVWRFLPESSWNPNRVRTFSSKSQEASV